MLKNSTLSFRKILLISFMLISVTPVLLLAYWVQSSALDNEIKTIEEKHLLLAKNLANVLDKYTQDLGYAFDVIDTDFTVNSNKNDFFQLLKKLGYQHIWVQQGKLQQLIFPRNQNLSEGNIPKTIWDYVVEFQKSPSYDKNKVNISGVVEGRSGETVFLFIKELGHDKRILASISVDYIRSLQREVTFGQRGHAAIVDQFGKVIGHPLDSWQQSRKDLSFLPPVKQMMLGVTGVTQFYTPAMNADMIAGHTVVNNTGWGIMIPQPFSELEKNATYFQNAALILALSGIIIAGFFSWWLSGYITRTLSSVIHFTENVASGEFDTYITVDKGIVPVEILKLIESFNRMIDKLKHKTEDSRLLTDRLREAQKIAKLGSWKLNNNDKTMWWSQEVYNLLGLDPNNIASPTLDIFVSTMEESQRLVFLDLLNKYVLSKNDFSIDCILNLKNGITRFVHQDIVVKEHVSDNSIYISGTMQDVTERKSQEDRLYIQANYDVLTGLPNRQLCLKKLDDLLQETRKDDGILPLFLVGLDHFKEVNGSLGHNVGDKLLKLAGDRLQACIKETDCVARLGSDEFSIFAHNVTSHSEISKLGEHILEAFQKPMMVDYYEVFVSVSIGISIYPENDALNPLLLLQKADTALHEAKSSGRGTYKIFTSIMDEKVVTRMNLRSDLPLAIENSEFHVVFQPIVDSRSGKVVCAEALLRWVHPTKGFIPPDKFISIAEESGYIAEIGLWVLDEACKELKKWHNNGFPDLYISVNLSLRQIQLGLERDTILDILQKHRLPPEFLTLEVTESLLMENVEKNLIWLNDVSKTGIRFSIDDFGTGYSSLSYLLNLPVSILKIDRAFVMNILEGSKDATLIEMIITLSKRLGYKIVAEGVETEGQLNKLIEYECDLIQGYYFSKPLKPEDFMVYLKANDASTNVSNIKT